MATNAANTVTYYLSLPASARAHLANIRHWEHLKLGEEQDTLWVKGFTMAEIKGTAVASIPFAQRYHEVGPKLHKLGSQLPERTAPAVLWTPISRALPVSIEQYNHNFFGLGQSLSMELKVWEQEEPIVAQMVVLDELKTYIEEAPELRLQPIKWLIVNDKALLLGKPLLPLMGTSYWKNASFLLPAGYNWSPSLLVEAYAKKLDPSNEYWTVVETDGSYFQIRKSYCKALSIDSFRNSLKAKRNSV